MTNTMKSIFQKSDTEDFISRINKLTSSSPAQWGKMNVTQMLAHCRQPLRVATGELQLKRGLAGILFGGIAKKKMTGPGDFSRNLPTDPSFIIHDGREFETEKSALVELIRRFTNTGPSIITGEIHPFFGRMTTAQWDILQTKHLDHHLRQFGV